MAPLRSSRASRLAARSHQDTDILSGYPARQWVKETSTVSLTAPKAQPEQQQIKKDSRFQELPMPRGSELYAPHAQLLLRRARAPIVPEDDKITLDEREDDAAGDEDKAVKLPKYTQIALGQETPGPRYLAERRKGLASLRDNGSQPKRKAKVKQTLADGTERIIEVLVPVGQTVPGEMNDAAPLVPEILPPGTVVEGVGIANREGIVIPTGEVTTPQSNRKPPPPKRKKIHPLKGKKKKVLFEVPNADGTVDMVEGAASGGTPRPDEDEDDDEDGEEGDTPVDSPMPDGPGTPSRLPELPRSAPVDIPPPSIIINSEASALPTGENTLTGENVAAQSGQTQNAKAPMPDAPAVEPKTAQASAISTEASGAPLASADKTVEALQATEPAATSTVPPVHDTTARPEAASEPATTPLSDAKPTISDPGAVSDITAVEAQETAPISEPSAPLPDAPIPLSQEPATDQAGKPDNSHATVVPDPVTDFVSASAQAAESMQSAAPENVVAQASPTTTTDAIPEALKPEEIALSNPTTDEAKALDEAKAQEEQNENDASESEQGDILGSLEQSLG